MDEKTGALEIAPETLKDPSAHGYLKSSLLCPPTESANRTVFPDKDQ